MEVAEAPAEITEAPAGKTPMSAIFERAMNGDRGDAGPVEDAATATPATPAVPATPSTPAAPASPKPAAPKPPEPPAEPDAFVPPAALLGEPVTPPPEAQDDLNVAEIMPEEPPASLKTEKAKGDYKKFRELNMSLSQKVKEREARIAELEKVQVDPNSQAEIQTLRQRIAELSDGYEQVNIERHPAFQQQFVLPRQQMMTAAKEAVEMGGADPKAFEKVMGLTGKARIEAIDELMENVTSPTLRNKISHHIDQIEELDSQKASILANAKQKNQEFEMQRRAEEHRRLEERNNQFSALLDSAVEPISKVFETLRKVPGNDKWNARIDADLEMARELTLKNPNPQDLAATALLATQTQHYKRWMESERSARMKLEKELAELKGAEPSLNGNRETATEPREGIASLFDRVRDGGQWGS